MTKSHKILVLVPPLLIGFSVLMVFLTVQHNKNQQASTLPEPKSVATSSQYVVTKPIDDGRDASSVIVPIDGGSVLKTESVACDPKERLVEACIEIFAPVCGEKMVACDSEQCDPPVPTEFPNSCFACMDDMVIGYTEGSCDLENNV